MALAILALYYGQLESFAVFLILFGMCIIFRTIPKTPSKKDPIDTLIINSSQRRNNIHKAGMHFSRLAGISRLFQYEMNQLEKKIPYTGRVIDAKRFVMYTSTVSLLSMTSLLITIPIVASISEIAYLYGLIMLPLLIPLVSPILLDGIISERKSKSASEFLAFVTYAGIMHTVHKTMFWTMQSICNYTMFAQLGEDSKIALRYAKGGGEEEGHSITLMAKYHPNRKFREFLEKYVSYIPTNITRLKNYVETAREESLNRTIQKAHSYADSANMVFFMGTMMVSILPIMFTVMAFLPGSGFGAESLIWVMFVIPLVFVVFPLFLSTGTTFLHAKTSTSKVSVVTGIICFTLLYMIFPDYWLASASISVVIFSGINYGINAKMISNGINADRELPDMLDYIAEQKKSKSNMLEIFSEYALLPNTSRVMRDILQKTASDVLVKSSHDAFMSRVFPSNTLQFVFFMLHAIYEHGGGSYESIVSMAHSIRKIVSMKDSFVSSSQFSVAIVVVSPAVFMFCVMMTSFVSFGTPADMENDITKHVMTIKATDVEGIVESLQPVVLIIAIAGGLGVSRVVRYSFCNTQYLFLTTIVSTVCIILWDWIFYTLQSLV